MFQTGRATSSGAPYLARFWRDVENQQISTHTVVVSHISQQNRWEIWGATCATRQNHYQYALSWSGRDDASSAKLLHLKQRGAACIQRDRVVG
jgi:cytochrome oxidase assembly protein ShyY1